jgi:hypothetical protein
MLIKQMSHASIVKPDNDERTVLHRAIIASVSGRPIGQMAIARDDGCKAVIRCRT